MWPFKKKIKRYVTFETFSGWETFKVKEDTEGQYYIEYYDGTLYRVVIQDYWTSCVVTYLGSDRPGHLFSL